MAITFNDVRERARQDEYLTPEEVAALLRVSRITIYRLIRQRDLQARRVGRQWRLTAASVLRLTRESRTHRRAHGVSE